MNNVLDLAGKKYHKLTVLEQSGLGNDGHYRWLCQCDCGNKSTVRGSLIISGRTKSCGCLRKIKPIRHGKARRKDRHPLYTVWIAMRGRCNIPSFSNYKNYGGRGIKICDRWNNNFEAFWEDMSSTYQPGLQIDRVNNDKGYELSNCRWVTPSQNAKNRRNKSNNQSKLDFVSYNKYKKKWTVQFDSKEQAELAYSLVNINV